MMQTSETGLSALKRREGLRLEAYQCSASEWTIGYGTRYTSLGPVRRGMVITESEAEELLKSDVRLCESRIRDMVVVPLTQDQFDTLVSFVYNAGPNALAESTLLRKLNKGDYDAAADEFLKWNKVRRGGAYVVDPGLVNRRKEERTTFLGRG
jgi:lysozyme